MVDADKIRRGRRWLLMVLVVAGLVALAGSIGFATGAFDDYPYGGF